ncbi:shikimate kinase [Clostridium oceanicum]|uniref:Shikimate kinase n=1 Tax=Clostridium oceanicum TaxID=1543 RepID=A0ABP3V667_9CLOT
MKKNIVLIGMPGCGKTSIGKILSEKINLEFYDVDKYIEEMTDELISSLFKKGEEYFRDAESSAIKEICKKENIVISTGGGVIKREENIKELKEKGKIFFINRPLENIINDIDTDSRPLLKDKKSNLINLYNERYELYKKYSDVIINNNLDLHSVIDNIISNINR